MYSAVAQHNDMCKQPVILGDSTNLCLQAETDMITTDEGRHDEILIIVLYKQVRPMAGLSARSAVEMCVTMDSTIRYCQGSRFI